MLISRKDPLSYHKTLKQNLERGGDARETFFRYVRGFEQNAE